MQNIVYKIKMEIGKNHPLYKKLPYYWYCHGPVCEPLHTSYNKITPENETLKDYPEIKNIINNIPDEDIYNLAEDIYRQYAPYEVLYPFKYKIFDETKKPDIQPGR